MDMTHQTGEIFFLLHRKKISNYKQLAIFQLKLTVFLFTLAAMGNPLL